MDNAILMNCILTSNNPTNKKYKSFIFNLCEKVIAYLVICIIIRRKEHEYNAYDAFILKHCRSERKKLNKIQNVGQSGSRPQNSLKIDRV